MREFAEVFKRIAWGAFETSRDASVRFAYYVRDVDLEEIPVVSTVDWFFRGLGMCLYTEGREFAQGALITCFPKYQVLIEDD